MRAAKPQDQVSAKPVAPVSATASSRIVEDSTAPPYNTAGRIFLRQGRYNAWCSGVAVNTPSRQIVLTAGHCLWDTLPRHRRPSGARYLQFVPGYSNGEAPYGAFVMEEGYVPGAWLHSGNPNFDLGAIVTYPNALGQNVADAVGGGAGIATNQPRAQSFQILGYPGANQQRMRECDPIFARNSPLSHFYPGPAQMMATCVLAPGSSGGPWFIGEPPMLNGITSQLVQLHPYDRYITSTYFNSGTIESLLEGL